ncbi:MAG: response regulator [Methylococcaceae bacterium]|nr:response regulator [Methylococcaceae bacterium]
MSIKSILYQAGVQHIVEAENASVALAAMEKQKFDIVLCDYNLGASKNGQQLLEEAKYRKLLPYTAIFIMVTAEQASSMVLSAMENKPDEYLAKPFNAQQLFSRIEKQILRKSYLNDIEAAIDKDDLLLAIAHCNKLLCEQNPKTRTQLLKIGAELAINVGDFKTAQQYYQEVLSQRELAWAKHGLGVIAFLQNQFDTAIGLFKEVINQAPMMIETYDWLTKAYEAVEKSQDAQDTLKQAVELSPQALVRQQKLAVLAQKAGNLEVAQKAYKVAIKLGQNSVYTSCQDFAGLAKMYVKTNNIKEAFKLITEMRGRFHKNAEADLRAAHLETCIYFGQQNQSLTDQAYAKIKPITQQHNDIPKDLLLDIAEVHFLVGNIEASNQLIGDLIGNYVDDDSFINEIVYRHQFFSNDEFYADELFKRTKLELIEVNNKGVNLFKQGHVTEAFELLEGAYNKTPNNKFILMNLAKILLRDIRASGLTKDKLLKMNAYISKAVAIGVSQDKTGNIKMELTKLTALSTKP